MPIFILLAITEHQQLLMAKSARVKSFEWITKFKEIVGEPDQFSPQNAESLASIVFRREEIHGLFALEGE